jgi:hypothetical protein
VRLGPVEYVILGFPGDSFGDDVAPALAALVDAGTVRILDLLFLSKGPDGRVAVQEFDELDPSHGFGTVEGRADGVLSEGDAALAAQALGAGESAILLLWEDRWASPLADAVRAQGGVVLGGQRIPPEVIDAALADLPDEEVAS